MNYIYTLSCPLTNEVRYVGKSSNPQRRYNQHLYDKRLKTYCYKWIQSLKNKGCKPLLTVIDKTEGPWEELEIYWIAFYKNLGAKLCNLTAGGQGIGFYAHTDLAKSKISKAKKGRLFTEVHKKNISLAGKGRVASQESKDKVRQSLLGIKRSKESMEKTLAYTRKKLLQLDLEGNILNTYPSLSECERVTGYLASKTSLVCNGKRIKAYNFKWKFSDER